jgi:hypothetical protein
MSLRALHGPWTLLSPVCRPFRNDGSGATGIDIFLSKFWRRPGAPATGSEAGSAASAGKVSVSIAANSVNSRMEMASVWLTSNKTGVIDCSSNISQARMCIGMQFLRDDYL